MKIISWNISYFGNSNIKFEYLKKVISDDSAIIILQEVTKSSYELLKNTFSNYNIEYSLNYRKPSIFDPKSRGLGIVVMTSKNIEILNASVVERCILPERTLLVEVKWNNKMIKVLGLHSITGCDYKKAKSLQFYSFAETIETYKPDIVGIDANEPNIDNYNIKNMVFFDNKDKGKGAKMFFETLIENNLVDAYGVKYDVKKFRANEPLTISHKVNQKINKRYDFIFLNKKIFKDFSIKYNYENSIIAESDHSLIEICIK